MSFVSDLEFWKVNEKIILEKVKELYPLDEWKFSELKTEVDIVSSSWKTIECKSDRLSLTTWNVFIEVECNKVPSWIYKYSSIDVLAYSYWNTSLLVNVNRLKNFIIENEKTLKKIKCGDGWRSVWYLIKLKEFEQLSSIIITHN